MDQLAYDEYFMKEALKEAEKAYKKGEIPVGALIVVNGEIISKAHNIKETTFDPTAHAEILAIREAARILGAWRLTDATLYVTKEPCIMCSGAIVNSRIKRLVYGCNDPKGGAVVSLYNILNDKRLNHQVEITNGILEEECRAILKRFFKELRED
ncbi:tRNA adenosine(34) deaminase TadA [Thermodesulfovibrio yellowstonii]|uniref:tRNA adenosine(34) deaminase TadA n=1 Tax=Thermodesulfovibrio yellowstonii TaxID=28262 RepID=UPI0003FF8C05|nr:tRNA adenosine(34) deaminase TadA [Thermodesulfovibrio islandicus]